MRRPPVAANRPSTSRKRERYRDGIFAGKRIWGQSERTRNDLGSLRGRNCEEERSPVEKAKAKCDASESLCALNTSKSGDVERDMLKE